MGYPNFDKAKSSVYTPHPPYDASDPNQRWRYKQEVQEYVDSTEEYLKATKNDIQRIREAQEEAIRKANAVVEEYNSWVRRNSN